VSASDAPPPIVIRWVVAVIVLASLIWMIAIVRGEPGAGGRDPGPDDDRAAAVVQG
jgi:hypothetical protein